MQPFRSRVDLEVIAMKGFSLFSKAPTEMEPYQHIQDTCWEGSYPPEEIQSIIYTAKLSKEYLQIFKEVRLEKHLKLHGISGEIW